MTFPIPSYENMFYIVAGNHRQAQTFAGRHFIPPIYWKNVTSISDLLDAKGSVVYFGTFYQRADIADLRAQVEANPNLKVLDLDE